MKNKDCFKKLAKHLDDLPGGFPSTESGVEIRILHRLFTEEEARLAVHLILIPEEAAAIAKRAGLTPEEAATRLEDMAKKGLISRYHPKGRKPKYMAAQFVIGIWEYHVNDLSPELIKDMDEYMPHLLDVKVWKKTPQLRTVPVGQSISVKHEVMAYENAEQLIRSHKRFLVAPCICRRERTIMGEGCNKSEEMCLIMGGAVHYYEENGLGCLINLDDALALLKKADKEGLVISPSNAKKIANICFCCGCCCGVLRTIKKHPKPAEIVSSPFIVSYDPSSCKGCEVCIDRCQMDAIKPDGDKIVVNLERCIGCGLCVTTCPTESFVLERKPEAEQTEVPDSLLQTYIKLGRERGKLNFIRLAGLWLRFKTKNLSAKK